MRKLPLLWLLLSLLFVACEQEGEADAEEDYAESAEALDEMAESDWEGPYMRKSGPAVIVGSRVNVRAGAKLGAPRLTQLNEGHQVKILSVSPERLTVTGQQGTCEAYPWVEVEFGGQQPGWVYGKYVGWRLAFSEYAHTSDSTFFLNGIQHHLAFYRNYQYGVMDAYGLSGCEDFVTVAFVEKDLGIIHFPIFQIEMTGEEERWHLNSDDGVNESIEAISVRGERVVVRMHAGYQEGESDYEVTLYADGDEGIYYASESERQVEYP